MLLFSTFIVALVVTMALIPPLIRVAERLSVVDIPDARKVHTSVIPRIGGLAMMVGGIVPILLWLPINTPLVGMLVALAVLLIFGTWDDSRDLDYRLKFLGQFIAVLIVIFVGDVKLAILPFAGMDPVPDFLSVPITVVFLVGATNAVNLSDGLDGLAAGVSLLSLCAIALLAYLADGADVVLICSAVAGAIFGFLRYNTFPARVFMGDTGSQFLGFVLGALSIIVTQKTGSALNPLLPLFLLGLPIVDTAMVMLKRLREGRSVFSADKNHMHHQLLAFGVAHYEAVAAIYLVQMLFIGCALLLRFESDLLVFAVYVGLFGAIALAFSIASARGWRVRHEGITRFISAVDKSARARRLPANLLSCAISLYLVVGSAVAASVPPDLVIAALVLLGILVPRLIWADTLRFLPLRILVFSTIAFVVYLLNYNPRAAGLIPLDLKVGLLVALVILMIFAVRYAKKDVFQTTPTDLLVIALAGGVGAMYEYNILDDKLVPLMVELVVLFYAGEIVMRQMERVWNCFTVGIIAALVLISARLVI